MIRGCIFVVAAGCVALSALGQQPPPERPTKDSADAQPQSKRAADGAPANSQDRPPEPRVMRPPPPGEERIKRVFDRIADELALDKQQREQFDQIVKRNRQNASKRQRDGEPNARNGDEPGRLEGPRGGNPLGTLLDDVEPILHEDQMEKFERIKQRFGRRPSGSEGPELRMMERMADELDLDESQREKFNQIVRSIRQDSGQSRGQPEEIGRLYRELREARDEGDEDKAREIEHQISEKRPDREKMMEAMFQQIEGLLRDDQKPRLAEYRSRMTGAGADPQDYRQIFRAARRLRLEEHQKDQIRDMEKAAEEEMRQGEKRDRQARSEIAAKVKKDILAILDEEQAKQFEQDLQRLARREGGPERRQRPDAPNRGPRDGNPAPPGGDKEKP